LDIRVSYLSIPCSRLSRGMLFCIPTSDLVHKPESDPEKHKRSFKWVASASSTHLISRGLRCSQVSGALKSRTTNKTFPMGATLSRMDENGHGRLDDGGEIFGDILLTVVRLV
jgi:hypothetical protein